MLFSGPFRPFSDPVTQQCVQDIHDGYFPSELQTKFPDGVPFVVSSIFVIVVIVVQKIWFIVKSLFSLNYGFFSVLWNDLQQIFYIKQFLHTKFKIYNNTSMNFKEYFICDIYYLTTINVPCNCILLLRAVNFVIFKTQLAMKLVQDGKWIAVPLFLILYSVDRWQITGTRISRTLGEKCSEGQVRC